MNDIKSITKSNEILKLFAKKQQPLSIKEIREALEIPQSTAYRIIKTHVDQGILEAIGNGYYKTGWVIQALYEPVHPQYDKLIDVAKPLIEEAATQLKETVILTTIRGSNVFVLETAESTQNLRFSFSKNEVFLPYYGASSKVLLAFAEENYIRDMLEMDEDLDKEVLSEELQKIREKGYAKSHSEVDIGAIGIGVPIILKNKLIGGVSVAAPDFRIDAEKEEIIIAQLKEIAENIRFHLMN